MSDELKPCPFCGSTEAKFDNTVLDGWIRSVSGWISCTNCGAEGPHGINMDRAIERWNTRADVAQEGSE